MHNSQPCSDLVILGSLITSHLDTVGVSILRRTSPILGSITFISLASYVPTLAQTASLCAKLGEFKFDVKQSFYTLLSHTNLSQQILRKRGKF